MVWPILISVAVTPRISAAPEATEASTATEPTMPTPETKRIDPLPRFIAGPSMSAASGWPAIPLSSKHAMLGEWMPFIIAAGSAAKTAWQALRKLRNLADELKIIAENSSSRAARHAHQGPLSPIPFRGIARRRDHGRLRRSAASGQGQRGRRGVSRKALAQLGALANPRGMPRLWLRLSRSVRPDAGQGLLSEGDAWRRAFGEGGAKAAGESSCLVRPRRRPLCRHRGADRTRRRRHQVRSVANGLHRPDREHHRTADRARSQQAAQISPRRRAGVARPVRRRQAAAYHAGDRGDRDRYRVVGGLLDQGLRPESGHHDHHRMEKQELSRLSVF